MRWYNKNPIDRRYRQKLEKLFGEVIIEVMG